MLTLGRIAGVALGLAAFGSVVALCALGLALFGEDRADPLDPAQTTYPHEEIRA